MPTYRLAGGFFCPQIFPGEDDTNTEGLASGSSISPIQFRADYYSDPERRGMQYTEAPPWQLASYRPTLELYDYRRNQDDPDGLAGLAAEPRLTGPVIWSWRTTVVYDDAAEAAAGGTTVTPGTGAATWDGFAPTVTGATTTVTPGVGQATWTGIAPTVKVAVVVAPGVGQATWAGVAPSVNVTNNITVQPGIGQATWSGIAPTVTGPAVTTAPATGGRTRKRIYADYPKRKQDLPRFELAEDVVLRPGTGQLEWQGFAPKVLVSQWEQDERLLLGMALDDPDLERAFLRGDLWMNR